MSEFFSSHAIGDDVMFRPMYRQQVERGIADEERDGRIVAVRFTEVNNNRLKPVASEIA